jgi:hypothetical protein
MTNDLHYAPSATLMNGDKRAKSKNMAWTPLMGAVPGV